MRSVTLALVPQGAQVVLPDLGLLGTRVTPSTTNADKMVEIEIPHPGKDPTKLHYKGWGYVYIDDSTELFTG